jgi:Ice-binding-like
MKINRGIMMAVVAIAGWQSQANAQIVKVDLGSAEGFAVLAGTAITNTGSTIVNGDLGLSPGTAVTGFPPGSVNGTIHVGDATIQAQADALAAYNSLAGETDSSNLTGTDLGGLTLTPGVYHFDSTAQLTGVLTLNAGGNPNARFDFQIGTALTTAGSSQVTLSNGAQADYVFWQVGSAATLNTGTSFEGNILASTSITSDSGAAVNGRLLALNGAVTLDNNSITASSAAVPEPATTSALIAGFSGLLIGIRRIRSITTRRADL